MPEIIGIHFEPDSIEVKVSKDGGTAEASGRIYAYPTPEAAKQRQDPQAHHVGDWFSPAGNATGAGTIGAEHLGKWLMVDQRSGATATPCTNPFQAGIGIE